jgi:peptidoglycan/xylan/chitin deacetylase (PgdA/CDA1 family)
MAIDLLDEMLAFTEALLREPEPLTRLDQGPRPPVDAPVVPSIPRPPAPPTTRRRYRRAPPPVPFVGFLILVLLAVPAVSPTLRLRVDGRPVLLHAQSPTVDTVLRRTGIIPVDGVLLAVVTRRTLDEHFQRATILRDGEPVTLIASVRNGDALAVRNGRSMVEPTVHRTVAVPGGGLPDIEYQLWNAPRAGSTDQLVGASSNEVVSQTPVSAPVAATPVTDPAVALTFDDGPNPASTPAVLAILRAAGIKATFCVVGYAAQRYPDLVRAIRDEGHTLCNHTMHHVQLLGSKPADAITAELRDDNAAIGRAAGVRALFFRAPGGTWAGNLVDEVHRQGMRALGWNVDPADYKRPGAAIITARILAQLRPGAVILMHDGGGDRSQTVAQLPGLIERLKALGYTFRVPA